MMRPCTGDGCITIGYSIVGEAEADSDHSFEWIDDIMKKVAFDSQLTFQRDVKRLTVGSVDDFLTYIDHNRNQTRFSIVWCTSTWVASDYNLSIPCQFDPDLDGGREEMIFYSIWTNKTLTPDNQFRPSSLPVQS